MSRRLIVPFALLFGVLVACGEFSNPGDDDDDDTIDASGDDDDDDMIDAAPPDADPCDTNACECDDDSDCGEHEFCDMSGPGRVCACVAGYTGDPCVWGGAPADPGFEMNGVWAGTGGSIVDPAGPGDVSPGEGIILANGVCQLGGFEQTFTMPPYDKAEPFVARVSYLAVGGEKFDEFSGAVAFNGSWTELPRVSEFTTETVCLGAAAYGGDVTFTASVSEKSQLCGGTPTGTVTFDHFEVDVAADGQCPMPGEAVNGDAEGTGGWDFFASGDGAVAEIRNGIGQGGTRGVRAFISTRCTTSRITGTLSVPLPEQVPSPALQIWWRGSSGDSFPVTFAGREMDELQGTGAGTTRRWCLPPWTHGGVHELSFSTSYGSGSCADVLNTEIIVDNVQIVSEPSCGSDAAVNDPGFESAPVQPFGTVINTFQPGGADVRALSNAGLAHSGTGVLEIRQSERCSRNGVETWVMVPEPEGTDGPAVRVWARVPSNAVSTSRISTAAGNVDLPENNTWAQHTACLDPDFAGRPARVFLQMYGGGGSCTFFGGDEFSYWDDITVGTDPSCPAN